jgi:uncharacterized protein YjbI with pentapeptide repeats
VLVYNETPLTIGWVVTSLKPSMLSGTFVVKGTFRLQNGAPPEFVEKPDTPTGDVPYPEGPEGSLLYESDFAPWKPAADLLLVGSCYARGGRPVEVSQVSFSIESWTKKLAVIGNRTWKNGLLGASPSGIEPFTRMPLGYDRAFGGEDYKLNPIGKGSNGKQLPNVESPEGLITSRDDRPDPAGFGPIPRTWPQRNKNLGTYNSRWQKERWPWLPEDFDYHHFNAAPVDQQSPRYLSGQETIRIENMHPEHPLFSFQLPGLKPQVFYRMDDAGHEVDLVLDTLWINMDEMKMVLLWRGAGAVRSLKMQEVDEIHVRCDRNGTQRSTWQHCVDDKDRQKAQELKAKEQDVARDAEEKKHLAAAMKSIEAEDKAASDALDAQESEAEAWIQKRAAELNLNLGINPALPPEIMASLEAAAFAFAQGDPQVQKMGVQIPPPEPIEEPAIAAEDEPWTRERCISHAAQRGSFSELDLRKLDLSDIDFSGLDLSLAALAGANLKECRLEKADLSGADLSGCDLTGCTLSGAQLVKASAAGAILDGSNLAGANLSRAVFTKASLKETVLEGVVAQRTDFAGADISKSRASKADFKGSFMDECNLSGTDFSGANLAEVSMEKVSAAGVVMVGANLNKIRAGKSPDFTGASFAEAEADESYWEGAQLERTDFRSARLYRSDFTGARMRASRLDRISAREARFEETDLESASVVAANLFQASFERARLVHANFSQSNMFQAEFWEADTSGALFQGTNLKRTKLAGKA